MDSIASQITSLTIVCSAVYSGADQRKHQSSASLAFVRGIHRDRWIPRTNGQLRGKCFHLMTSSWMWLQMAPGRGIAVLMWAGRRIQRMAILCGCNSLSPVRSECDLKDAIFNLDLLIGIFRYSQPNALRWMPHDLTGDKSILVQ